MEIANQVRGYRFLLGILRHQQEDPYCGRCSAFANTLKAAQERLAQFSASEAAAIGALPADLQELASMAQAELASLRSPEQPTGQKKAGNCRLPPGVCFIKASLALLQRV